MNFDSMEEDAERKRKREKDMSYNQLFTAATKQKTFPWFSYQDGGYLCTICKTSFKADRLETSRLRDHEGTVKHKKNSKQSSIASGFKRQESKQRYHEDVAALLLSANIPLQRAEHLLQPAFIAAVVARGEQCVLSANTYRKDYASPSHYRYLSKALAMIANVPYSLLVDESSKSGRKIINFIVVTAENRLLVETKVFEGDHALNATAMYNIILNVLNELSLSHELLVGITRDNASYMVKAVAQLNEEHTLSHVLSVACLSHGLNLVVRALLDPFVTIRDTLFSTLKKLFAKPSARRSRAGRALKGLLSAVQVSQTRWSSWLDSIVFVYNNISAIVNIVEDEYVRADNKGKTSVKTRLMQVKELLTKNYDVLCTLTALASIAGDLQCAIKESQSNNLNTHGLHLIEDGFHTLSRANVICAHATEPSVEMNNNEEYAKARESVSAMVFEGRHAALQKWEERVQPTLDLCFHSELFKPLYWIEQSVLPEHFPKPLAFYGRLSTSVTTNCFSDWYKYTRFIANLKTNLEVHVDEYDDKKVAEIKGEVEDYIKFWKVNGHRFPSLSKIAECVLAFCPSGAEIERSFKLLRNILPKDHTRDCVGESTIMYEMFFAYNRNVLDLFNLNT